MSLSIPSHWKTRIVFTICLFCIACVYAQNTTKKNILFIAIDDLRPELGCYGVTYIKTPNIDRLAKQGLLFENAYCQQAVCAPSRNSMMTGLRPDAMRIYDLGTFFRKTVPDVITMPQQFKNNGYISEAVGKIYHNGHGNQDDMLSWSIPSWNYNDQLKSLQKIKVKDTIGLESSFPKVNGKMLPYYKSPAPEEQMVDGAIADIAVKRLKDFKNQDKPFFLAVGFKLPHLPFVAPSKYWDLYDPKNIEIPEKAKPEGSSSYAFVNWSGELNKYHGIEKYKSDGFLPDEISRNLIHGYYASVSMMDAQVGKLLDELDKSGLRENTIIVLWGDHGWKLGEYGTWCKHSNTELDTRSPLIISDTDYQANTTRSLAEFIDVYPTLCDLAGIQKPDHLQGTSLVPILQNPQIKVKEVAMSQYPRGKALASDITKQKVMGYSVTDGRFRFTRWQSYENPKVVYDKELYDHADTRLDQTNLMDSKEFNNVALRMEQLLDEVIANTKNN